MRSGPPRKLQPKHCEIGREADKYAPPIKTTKDRSQSHRENVDKETFFTYFFFFPLHIS